MKKKVIIVSISVWVFIIIISIGVAIYSTVSGGSMLKSNAELIKEEKYLVEEIKDIIVNTSSMKLELVSTDDDEILIQQYGKEKTSDRDLFQVQKDRKVLSVRQEHKWRLISLWNVFDEKLVVHIPKKYMKNIELKSKSGGIKILDSFTFENVKLTSSSGGINVKDNLELKSLYMKISSGGLLVEGDLKAKDKMELIVTSGSVKLQQKLIANTLFVKSSSGGIKLNEVDVNDLDLKCTSGSVKVKSFSGKGYMKSSSGGIDLKIDELKGDMEIKCTSGSTKINIDEDIPFLFEGKCISGSIRSNFDMEQNSKKNYKTAKVGKEPKSKIKANSASGGISIIQE